MCAFSMSHTSFKTNFHSKVTWMWTNLFLDSLLFRKQVFNHFAKLVYSMTIEAVFRRCCTKKVLYKKNVLKISQNSQENICARVSFLIKLQAWRHRTKSSGFEAHFSSFNQYIADRNPFVCSKSTIETPENV